MKHIVTIVQNDSTCACFAYDSKATAMAKYHHEMEYAYNAGITTLCTVMNSNGATAAIEKYTAQPAPNPENNGGEE